MKREQPRSASGPQRRPTQPVAQALSQQISEDSKPRSAQVQLVTGGPTPQLLVVDRGRVYDIPDATAREIQTFVEQGDSAGVDDILTTLGLKGAGDSAPPALERDLQTLSLMVSHACNLGCSQCRVEDEQRAASRARMSLETACRAIDTFLEGVPGRRANLAFLGGEPLVNRSLVRVATRYAEECAAKKGLRLTCSLLTTGTLLTPDDAHFLARHRFTVTVSLTALERQVGQRGRSWEEPLEVFLKRSQPLLQRGDSLRLCARVSVSPETPDLPHILERLASAGFHSVYFAPRLRTWRRRHPDEEDTFKLLENLILCGLEMERHVSSDRCYPFQNLIDSLWDIHRGRVSPFPCGAGSSYLAVSAEGRFSTCHRFGEQEVGALGDLARGINPEMQETWLRERQVDLQEPCDSCWARYLCGGHCHYESITSGRTTCDFIRGWYHYALQAHGRLQKSASRWLQNSLPGLATDSTRRETY